MIMGKQVELELKAVKYSKSLSQETYAFTAKMYVNGRKYADVSNNGGGGPNLIHRVKHDGQLDAAVMEKAYKELQDAGWGDCTIEVVENWASEAVTQHLLRKDMKADFRKSIVFRKTKNDAALMSWKRPKPLTVDQCVTSMRETWPDMVVLNTMPEDEAFKEYKSACA
jgi:hypothetical protein